MGRPRHESEMRRYSVLVEKAVDDRLQELMADAGEKTLSDTVRRVLREATSADTVVRLNPEVGEAVKMAARLSGLTPSQIVTNLLRQHLGSVIEAYREDEKRLKAALLPTPGEKGRAGAKR